MGKIIKYKEIVNIETYDNQTIPIPVKLDQIEQTLNDDSKFIRIGSEIINKSNIKRARTVKVNDLESFILSQSEDIRNKLREKQRRLKKELNKEMSLEYAKNYVLQLNK